MRWCNVWRIRLNPLQTKVLTLSKRRHPITDCSIRMDNINLKAAKSFKFLGAICDYKLMFEENIKAKIHNSQHIVSSFYYLKSHQYRIPDKTDKFIYFYQAQL